VSQHYSNPERDNDPHALPNVEVFYVHPAETRKSYHNDRLFVGEGEFAGVTEPGWYWWSCFPGCLPDSDPVGPFATEAEALADAQDGAE